MNFNEIALSLRETYQTMKQVKEENKKYSPHKYQLKIGVISVFEDYILAKLNEGITLNIESVQEIIGIQKKHFPVQPFVYITVRENSYAVDPTMYFQILEIENLRAIAVVSTKFLDEHNIKIEKHFFKKPMNIFKDTDKAVSWARAYLK